MKIDAIVLLMTGMFVTHSAYADMKEFRSNVKSFLTETFAGELEFSFQRQKIQFQGCKQKAYDLVISKPFTDQFSIDMSLGYAKGHNNWGIFSQTVLVKEYQIVPRWQFDEFALGMGVKMQSAHQLRSSHGPDFNLPLQKEWAVEADIPTYFDNHNMRISLAHQQWQSDDIAFTDGEYNAENNAINIEYSIVF